jgi:secreted effector protein SseF
MSIPPGIGMGRPGNLVGTTGTHDVQSTPREVRTTETPSQQAPLSLTLPPPPRRDADAATVDRVRSVATEPVPQGSVAPSRADVAKGKLLEAGEKLLEARKEGVDVAKSTFWKKALGVALSAVSVGVAAGLAAISFGGATPLLALACVNFAVSSGDAVCAYRNMRNTEAIAEMRPPPYDKLPAGNSILGNVAHALLTRCGLSEGDATVAAKAIGGTVALGLGIATAAVGAGLSSMPMAFDLVGKVTAAVSTAVSVGSTVTSLLTDASDREVLKQNLDSIRQDVNDLQRLDVGTSELDTDGHTMARNILSSMSSSDNATAMHDRALDNTGRTQDAVRGAAGILKPVLQATGAATMMMAMVGMRG